MCIKRKRDNGKIIIEKAKKKVVGNARISKDFIMIIIIIIIERYLMIYFSDPVERGFQSFCIFQRLSPRMILGVLYFNKRF